MVESRASNIDGANAVLEIVFMFRCLAGSVEMPRGNAVNASVLFMHAPRLVTAYELPRYGGVEDLGATQHCGRGTPDGCICEVEISVSLAWKVESIIASAI